MSVHLSEEEQLEILKRWWKDYGNTVIIAVLIAVGGYFAVTGWQQQQRQQKEAASSVYESLLKVSSTQPGQELTEENKLIAVDLANQLKEKNNSTLYAHNAAFYLASSAVNSGDLEQAIVELNWVLANKPDVATEQLARLRLARVLIAQASYDKADALLVNPADAFKSEYTEARADILKARGNLAEARIAYEQALTEADPKQQERSMLLQLKIDDLKSASDNEPIDVNTVEATQ